MPTETIGLNTTDTYNSWDELYLYSGAPSTWNGNPVNTLPAYTGGSSATFAIRPGISALPSGATITAVRLYMRLLESYGVNRTVTFNRSLRNADYGAATWDTWSAANNWTTGGGQGSGTDVSATASGTIATGTSNGAWVYQEHAQLLADVQDFYSGALSNYGWIGTNPGGTAAFYGSNAADGSRPYLEVTYTATDNGARARLATMGVGR